MTKEVIMMRMTDQFIFISGIVLSAVSAAAFIAGVVIYKFKTLKLDKELDREYGAEDSGR